MIDHSNYVRGFIWSSRAYYAQPSREPDSISFGLYDRDGGAACEGYVTWYDLGGKIEPRLEVFGSNWSEIFAFEDLFGTFSKLENESISPEKFVEILKSCGFEDFTAYENPVDKPYREQLLSDLKFAEERVRKLRNKLAEAR